MYTVAVFTSEARVVQEKGRLMWVLDKLPDSFDVRLSRDEMFMLNNTLNEICNGIHIADQEFQTRLGLDREAFRALLRSVAECL